MTQLRQDFPSGSKWGPTQLKNLAFPLEPQAHQFCDLSYDDDVSGNISDVLARLTTGFGIEEPEWGTDKVDPKYRLFFDDLSDMRPRPLRTVQITPKRPATRSRIKLPSSSVHPSSVPDPGRLDVWQTTGSTQSTPSKLVPLPSIPRTPNSGLAVSITPSRTLKRRRSLSLPVLPSSMEQINEIPCEGFPSSQTDSTFPAPDETDVSSGSELSDGDRPESGVTSVIRILLGRICKEHNESNTSNESKFVVEYLAETLTIPICGDFPRTVPDLFLRAEKNSRKFSLLDCEACVSL